MIEWASGKLAEFEQLAQLGVSAMAVVMVISVWAKTKAFVPTIGALLFGAILTWGVHNSDILQDKVDQEFQSLRAPMVLEVRRG
jgi:hypothetical protein